MSIEGQGYFFTIYYPGFVCFVLYKATISDERLQDHWSSGLHPDILNEPLFQHPVAIKELKRLKIVIEALKDQVWHSH